MADAGVLTAPREESPVLPEALLEEVRRSHRDLSAVDWEFRRQAWERPELLARRTYAALDVPNRLLKFKLQAWPAFASRSWVDDFATLSVGVNRLIRSVPEKVFDNDPHRIRDYYGAGDPATIGMLLSAPTGLDTMSTRGDFIDTGDGMRCIEFNFSPSLGGWDAGIIAAMHRQVPATAAFLDRYAREAHCPDTLRLFFDYLLRQVAAGADRVRRVHVAFITDRDNLVVRGRESQVYLQRELQAACAAQGLEGQVVLCHFGELAARRGRLQYGDLELHAAVNLCDTDPLTPDVFRAFKSGRVVLFNSPLEALLTSKRNLALLSRHQDSPRFTAEEQALIARAIPWTRDVGPEEVEWQGESHPLPRLLRAERPRLVLKQSQACGGKGVVLGRVTSGEEWEGWIEQALAEGGWVVQEVLESRPYLFQAGDSGCRPHDMIWGPFVFGDEYAGVILRMQPKADGRAVNLSLDASEGVLFEIDDTGREAVEVQQ